MLFRSLKIEPTDRRFVVFKASNEKMGDFNYFSELGDWINDERNIKGFFEFLMKRDISGVRFQKDRPITDEYMDSKLQSISLINKFVISEVLDFQLTALVGQAMREKFRAWAKSNTGKDIAMDDKVITKELGKVGVNSYRTMSERGYKWNIDEVKQKLVEVTKIPAEKLFESDM